MKYAKTPAIISVLRGSVLMDRRKKGPGRGPCRGGGGYLLPCYVVSVPVTGCLWHFRWKRVQRSEVFWIFILRTWRSSLWIGVPQAWQVAASWHCE